VRDGVLQINDRQRPLDFAANDILASSRFDRRDQRYDVSLNVGKIGAKYQDYRELPLAAQADISVWQDRAQIKHLGLKSQNSTAELSGTVNNFSSPEVHVDYSANLDLPQAAAVARVAGFRKGSATLTGTVLSSPAQYSASGKLSARDIDYFADGAQLRNASLAADYQANNAGLKLGNISGRLLGGAVTGRADTIATPPSGRAELKLAGISLSDAARFLSTRSMPLDKLNLAGVIAGTMNFAWKGTPSRSVAELALDVTPPNEATGGRLAMAGTIRGSYDLGNDVLELRPLQLSTQATQIQANGRLGARSAALNLTLQTSNLSQIDDVLTAFGEPRIPLQLSGQASFQGTVNGAPRNPEIAGHLTATQFSYLYTPPPTGNSPSEPHSVHIDSFAGDLSYSQDNVALHQATLTSAGMTLNVDGSAALDDGNFVDNSAFQLHAVMHNGDLAGLQQTLGTGYPLTGNAELTVQASGTKASPNGHGSFMLTNAAIKGNPVDSLSGEASLQNDDLHVTKLTLKAPGGTITGSGRYNFNTHQMLADLHSDDIQLAQMPELQLERLSTAGVAGINLHASGTPQNPDVNAEIKVEKLVLNQEHVGALTLQAVTHDQQMVITGRSNFEHAVLTIDGKIAMNGDFPGNLDVQFRDLDIDPFLSEGIKGTLTAHSGVAGRAHLSGPMRQPRQLTGDLTIDDFHAEIEKVAIHTDGPIEVALANGTVQVKRLAINSNDTEFHLVGSAHLAEGRRLNLYANGSINMALLQTLSPDVVSSGKAILDVTIRGTVDQPLMTGTMQVSDVSMSDIDMPAALSDLNGSLVFTQTRLEIASLTGHVGGGMVQFAGYIGYANGLSFNITAAGSDIRFRYSGISVTANQLLKLQGTPKNSTVSGDITITRFAQIPSADLSAALANASAPVPNATSPLNNLHFDVHVRSAPELTVQTSVAKLSGDVDLRLKGTALNPVLLGRVNIAQGDIKINGQKYFLERGDLTFANPVRVDPILDVEAKTRVRDFDVTIGLHGTLTRLSTTYRSDPPLSSEDIISLLTLGKTQQEYALSSGSSASGLGEATGNAVVGAAINQLVSNRVSRLFGVSAIRINPAVGGPDNNPNARLTVEQQVSSNVTITYITNLARSAQQVLEFEYNVSRDYTINATRDENGVVSFDLLIRKRKK
jgi:translocation and assembly module TamB